METREPYLESERLGLHTALAAAADAVVIVGDDGRVRYLNPAAERMADNKGGASIGAPVSDLFRSLRLAPQKSLPGLIDAVLASGTPAVLPATTVLLDAQGQPHAVGGSLRPIADHRGQTTGVALVFRTHGPHGGREQAGRDRVTGLADRGVLNQRLEQALAHAHDPEQHALLILDLDQFNLINGSCGHAAGDALLRQIGDLLSQQVRSSDTAARIGSDEFAVLLEDCPPGPAARIAKNTVERLAALEFCWQGRRFGLSASMGLVSFGAGGSLESVISAADIMSHLAKEEGGNRLRVYRSGSRVLARRMNQLDWAGKLRDVLEEGRLALHAQRVVPVHGKDTRQRWEILLRLREPGGALIRPDAFVPAAERYNLMPRIDRWVIDGVFRHLQSLPHSARANLVYMINLSGTTLSDENFATFVQRCVGSTGVSPRHICFEITETAAVANLAHTAQRLRELKALGFSFALDDFGTGMSSFGYLRALPVDFIKIDGEFVRRSTRDPADRAMIEAITHVARAMGLETIAEFVETEEIRAALAELGVDYAQGFAIQRPEPLGGDGLPTASDQHAIPAPP